VKKAANKPAKVKRPAKKRGKPTPVLFDGWKRPVIDDKDVPF